MCSECIIPIKLRTGDPKTFGVTNTYQHGREQRSDGTTPPEKNMELAKICENVESKQGRTNSSRSVRVFKWLGASAGLREPRAAYPDTARPKITISVTWVD